MMVRAMLAWPLDPSVYAGLLALVAFHAWLGRGAEDLRQSHGAYWLSGVLVIWAALETPIDTVSDDYLQSVHMLQHVLIGIIAPPLLLLGLSPSMAARLVRWVPGLRWCAHPVQAQVIFGLVMIGWHLPALYDLTLRSEAIHIFEHLTFMAGGFVYFWPVVAATSRQLDWQLGEMGRIVYLLLGTFPQDTVSLVLLFARRPLYDFYIHAPRLLALDPLSDQVLAGAVLMGAGKISYLVAILKIVFQYLARARSEESAGGRPQLAQPR
jgi:putative membrane protein